MIEKGEKLATFDIIDNSARIDRVLYTPEYSTVCSIGKAPFWGIIEIDYRPKLHLIEFESFGDWLFTLVNQSMTIEDLCRLVFDKLTEALGDIPLRVTVNARTTVHAPVSVSISRGDIT